MEIELKFQLPMAAMERLQDSLKTDGARMMSLRARYFDTPSRDLAQAGFALRLRNEGGEWVQTLKSAPSFASSVRSEHNVQLGSGIEPVLDPGRHRDTDDGRRLLALLERSDGQPLTCLYATDIERTVLARDSHGARIEYAVDHGQISASAGSLPVSEVEIELLSGPVGALPAAGRALVSDCGAWLDVRSKAMRGDSLARGRKIVPAASARNTDLMACVSALLVNASQLASDEGYEPSHLQQLQQGLVYLSELAARGERSAAVLDSRTADALSSRLAAPGAAPADTLRTEAVQHWLLELVAAELAALAPTR